MKATAHFRAHPICLSLVLLFGNASLSSGVQNLLIDPGFESGNFSASPLLGWSALNAAAISGDYSHSGAWALKDAYDPSGVGPVVAGIQILPAAPGATYTLSGWGLTPTTLLSSEGLLLVEFLDSNQQLINSDGTFHNIGTLDASTPTQTWTFLSGSVTAPPQTAYLEVTAELLNLSAGSNSDVVYYDDLNMTQVPEPTSLGLAGMALGLGVMRKRMTRKSH